MISYTDVLKINIKKKKILYKYYTPSYKNTREKTSVLSWSNDSDPAVFFHIGGGQRESTVPRFPTSPRMVPVKSFSAVVHLQEGF